MLTIIPTWFRRIHLVFLDGGLGRRSYRLALLVAQAVDLAISQTHRDLAMGKADAFALEQRQDFLVDPFADQPLIAGFGHELDPDDHR